MSEGLMPAFFRAWTMALAWEAFRFIACAAVVPCVVTPKSKEAWLGVTSTVPSPVTVMTVPGVGVALRPN